MQILPNDAKARRLFVTSGGLKKVQEIQAEPGTTLSEYITIINCCFPEEIVRLLLIYLDLFYIIYKIRKLFSQNNSIKHISLLSIISQNRFNISIIVDSHSLNLYIINIIYNFSIIISISFFFSEIHSQIINL